jgi:hypothetical protein
MMNDLTGHICPDCRPVRPTRVERRRDAELAAYLVQCLDALLTVSIVNMDLPY